MIAAVGGMRLQVTPESPVDRCPANPKFAGDGGCSHFFIHIEAMHFGRIDGGFAAAVDTARFRRRDPLQLTFTPQIGFKFGENTQHIEESFAGGGTRIDRLFRRLEGNAFQVQGKNNVLEVIDAAGEAVNPRDGKDISRAQEVQQQLQFGTPRNKIT